MVQITAQVKIRAPLKRVWEIISDLDAEPAYWKGTKSVKPASNEGGVLRREIIIAFRDKKCGQEIAIIPEKSVTITFTSGVIVGTKTITVIEEDSQIVLDVVWEIRLSGALGMFTGMLKKHIRGGTEQALQAIKKEAEGANPC